MEGEREQKSGKYEECKEGGIEGDEVEGRE